MHATTHPAPRLRQEPRIKVWLEIDGQYSFGWGLASILRGIEQTGSIKSAADQVGKSYRHIWGRIKRAEEVLGVALVETQVGGGHARRSSLTPTARQLLEEFDRLRERMIELVQQEFEARFGGH